MMMRRILARVCRLYPADFRARFDPDMLATIDQALERCRRNEELWYLPELLRIKGEIALREGAADANTAAEAQFRQALDWAQRQDVLAWQLRSATSLARLWRRQDRLADARDHLAAIYGRFTEGFATADLCTAKRLLDELEEDRPRRV